MVGCNKLNKQTDQIVDVEKCVQKWEIFSSATNGLENSIMFFNEYSPGALEND